MFGLTIVISNFILGLILTSGKLLFDDDVASYIPDPQSTTSLMLSVLESTRRRSSLSAARSEEELLKMVRSALEAGMVKEEVLSQVTVRGPPWDVSRIAAEGATRRTRTRLKKITGRGLPRGISRTQKIGKNCGVTDFYQQQRILSFHTFE